MRNLLWVVASRPFSTIGLGGSGFCSRGDCAEEGDTPADCGIVGMAAVDLLVFI